MIDIPGYQNQKFILEKALETKKYAHAYLFVGADDRKKDWAIQFAKEILGINGTKFNPDLILLDEEKLKIENIRNLIFQVSLRPYQSEYKVAVINNFETITDEGANSILKTLEEPNASTIIILVANNKSSLMETILSRVQTLAFDQKEFSAKDLNPEEKQELQTLAEIKKEPKELRLIAIKKYKDLEVGDLSRVFSLWLESERSEMHKNGGRTYKNPQLLSEAISGLARNFNKKSVLEKLFLNLV